MGYNIWKTPRTRTEDQNSDHTSVSETPSPILMELAALTLDVVALQRRQVTRSRRT